jgi:hypothetical protein
MNHPNSYFKLGDFAITFSGRLPCWRKIRHRNEQSAQAQLRSIARRGLLYAKRPTDHRPGKLTTSVYLCKHCSCWHVGRMPVPTPDGR